MFVFFLRVIFVALALSVSTLSLAQSSEPVAQVLGETVTLSDLKPSEKKLNELARSMGASKEMALALYSHGRLAETIMESVLNDYADSIALSVDEALVERFIEVFGPDIDRARAVPDGENDVNDMVIKVERSAREIAKEQVKHWQIEKALYEEFGGVVVFRSNSPQFPVGAYRKLLRKYQNEGKITITDGQYSAMFWKTFEPPYTAEIAPSNVDFAYPWWF